MSKSTRRLLLYGSMLLVIAVTVVIALPRHVYPTSVANENAATGMLRAIAMAQEVHRSENGQYATLGDLSRPGEREGMPLIRLAFEDEASPSRDGYSFAVHLAPGKDTWIAYAWPIEAGVTGHRTFSVDQTGSVRATGASATWNSGPAPDGLTWVVVE